MLPAINKVLNNRAQGLSLNTVVIAVVVLIVLLLLIAVFVLGVGKFPEETEDLSNCCALPLDPETNKCILGNPPEYGSYKLRYDAYRGVYKKGDKVGACCAKCEFQDDDDGDDYSDEG